MDAFDSKFFLKSKLLCNSVLGVQLKRRLSGENIVVAWYRVKHRSNLYQNFTTTTGYQWMSSRIGEVDQLRLTLAQYKKGAPHMNPGTARSAY